MMRIAIVVLLAMALQGCNKMDNTPKVGEVTAASDYQRAKYSEIHFKPAIEKAADAQCLACHAEVLKPSVSEQSPAGVKASETKAWYQQLSTYQGQQDTFHRRHMVTPLAKELMSMRCITCHQGNDPRDEAPGSSATSQLEGYTLRKHVDTEAVCVRCHGQMNWSVMGLPGPWKDSKDAFQNNCLLCHASVRTHRHQVNYLNAEAIEAAGKKSGDACFGCHGGRAWYRIVFPYPRHPWSGMPEAVPDWAKGRMTESEARFMVGISSNAGKK